MAFGDDGFLTVDATLSFDGELLHGYSLLGVDQR
jgi:hypothetical protein